MHVHVNTRTDADTECISARNPASSHGQVFGGTVRHKFPGGSSRSALPCEPQRSHVCYFTGKSVISSTERRKRRENHTAEHCLQHNIITLGYIVLPAILNMKLGAPREQQPLHKETPFHAQRLCKCAAAIKQRKQETVRAR